MKYLGRVSIIRSLKGKWLTALLTLAFSSQILANSCPPNCEMQECDSKNTFSSKQIESDGHSDCHSETPTQESDSCPPHCMTLSQADLTLASPFTQIEWEESRDFIQTHIKRTPPITKEVSIRHLPPPPLPKISVYLTTQRLRI